MAPAAWWWIALPLGAGAIVLLIAGIHFAVRHWCWACGKIAVSTAKRVGAVPDRW